MTGAHADPVSGATRDMLLGPLLDAEGGRRCPHSARLLGRGPLVVALAAPEAAGI